MRLLNLVFLITFVSLTAVAQKPMSPNVQEIYDFEVGDVFVYRDTYIWNGSPERQLPSYTYKTFKVTSKYVSGDTIIYLREAVDELDTIIVVDSINHPMNNIKGLSYVPMAPNSACYSSKNFSDGLIVAPIKDSLDLSYKMVLPYEYYYEFLTPDTFGYFAWPGNLFYPYSCMKIYAAGLGIIYEDRSFFESIEVTELFRFIHNEDTTTFDLRVEKTELLEFKIMPNPVSDYLQLSQAKVGYRYYITTTLGIEVAAGNIGSKNYQIVVSDLIPGVYVLIVETENGIMRKKFIKR